jgi:hypothetical protein
MCTGAANDFSTFSRSFKANMEYNAMPCHDCQARYCPDGPKEPQVCKDYCDPKATPAHPFICTRICGEDPESPECKECVSECIASCACESYCEPFTADAAICVENGGKWVRSLFQHFDNILYSMLTLFEISTTEGWVDVMYSGVDARGAHHEPVRD